MVAASAKPEDWGTVDIAKSATIPSGEAGAEIKFNLPIVNLGTTPVNNVRVVIKRNADPAVYPFTTNRSNEYIEYGAIAPGETTEREITLVVRKDALTKDYDIAFNIEYDEVSRKVILAKNIFVNIKGIEVSTIPAATPEAQPLPVDGPESGSSVSGGSISGGPGDAGGIDENKKSTTPRVIIEGFRTEPKVIHAGSSFKLILQVRNTSKKTAVNNMEINLQAANDGGDGPGTDMSSGSTSSSDSFLPDKGSNTLYLDKIAANKTEEIAIDLTARADLQQRPYSVGISMKYEDNNAEQFESSADISIPVKQEARVELSDIEVMPDLIEVGSEGNIIFSIYNLGRTKLHNVRVSLVGETISGGDAFLGNLEAGATGEVDVMVTGMAETMDDGSIKIQVNYEDQEGVPSVFEAVGTIYVTASIGDEGMIIEDDMMIMDEGQTGLNPLIIIAIVVAVIAIVGGTVAVIKHKRKKEEDFTDEFLGSDQDERK